MPKSKKVAAYPFAYRDLFNHVGEKGEFILHFADKAAARSRRFDLYGYKSALAEEGDKLINIATQIVMKIELNLSGGYDLILRNSLDDDINNTILAGIAASSGGLETQTDAPINPANFPDIPIQIPPAESGDLLAKAVIPIEDTNEQSCYKAFMQPKKDKEKG